VPQVEKRIRELEVVEILTPANKVIGLNEEKAQTLLCS